MIYSCPYPYFRSGIQFTLSETTGASVVHHDLLQQTLQHGVCASAELFLEWTPQEYRQQSDLAIRQLAERYGRDAVRLTTLSELKPGERIGVAKNCDMALALMTTRAGLGLDLFPICLITHSLVAINTLQLYTALCLTARPGDAIIATSSAARVWIQAILNHVTNSLYRQGINEGSLCIPPVVSIPLGTEPVTLLERETCRQILGLRSDDIVSLWLGRFNEHAKADLEPLLLLWPTVLREYPSSKLVLAGQSNEPAYANQLQALSLELGIAASIRVISNFPPPLKSVIFDAADIFISPVDNIQETFGVSLIEAMMHGLPIVASDWSGYRDIVQDGVTGILVPTYLYWDELGFMNTLAGHSDTETITGNFAANTIVDTAALLRSILALSGSPSLRLAFSQAGRAKALKEYSWARVIRLFGEAWEDQLRIAKVGGHVGDEWKCPDLRALFRPFASMEYHQNSKFCLSAAGKRLLEREQGADSEPGIALRYIAQNDDVTLADCSGVNRPSKQSVIWLLKKGFLEAKESYGKCRISSPISVASTEVRRSFISQ
jgi:glycosyltransferase involved in cell wall biosynthesis